MIAATLWCSSLHAQTQQQVDACEGKGSPPLDAVIGGCTALIQSGTYAGRDLATVFIIRAAAHQRKGELDRAIQDYDQATKLDPDSAIAYYNRGVAHGAKRDWDRAIQDYDQAIRHNPNDAAAFRNRGDAHLEKQQFDRALGYYERIKSTEGGGAADASLDAGMAQTMSRKFDFEISQLDPAAPDYAEKSAKLQTDKQAYQLEECRKRVERYPNDLQIRFELGKLYFQNGKIGEAIQEFQKSRANPNRKIQSLSYLGQCFAKRNMNDLAIRTFEEAIKDKPVLDEEKKELVYNLACVLEKTGKREEAIKQFEQIYAVDIGYKDVASKVDAFYAGQS